MNDNGCLDRGLVLFGAAAMASKGSGASSAKRADPATPTTDEESTEHQARKR